MSEKIVILDFGSQYTQLIARRVRELNVHPYNNFPDLDGTVRGVIFSGSPYSVAQAEAPKVDHGAIHGRFPLLAVCYGAQYLAQKSGGEVAPSEVREYGRANLLSIARESPLLKGVPERSQVWMSHGDTITSVPDGFRVIAGTDKVRLSNLPCLKASTKIVVGARCSTYFSSSSSSVFHFRSCASLTMIS